MKKNFEEIIIEFLKENQVKNYAISKMEGDFSLSNDFVFRVEEKNKAIYYFKAFTHGKIEEKFTSEIKAREIIDRINNTTLKTPKIIFKDEEHYILGFDSAHGRLALYDLLNLKGKSSKERKALFNKFLKTHGIILSGLRKIHKFERKEYKKLSKDWDTFLVGKIKKWATIHKISQGAKDKSMTLYKNFKKEKGFYSFCHGDANLGNFIINNNELSILDFTRTSLSIKNSKPIGLACYEHYQYLSSIFWAAKRFGIILTVEEIDSILYLFNKKGKYFFTKSEREFFAFYWNLRMGKIY